MKVRRFGFPRLMAVVRSYDGARVTYAFEAGTDIDRACDTELAGWFDIDLDAATDLMPLKSCLVAEGVPAVAAVGRSIL